MSCESLAVILTRFSLCKAAPVKKIAILTKRHIQGDTLSKIMRNYQMEYKAKPPPLKDLLLI